MSDPAVALQKAIFTTLDGAGIADKRIYDRVPPDAAYPYLSFGPVQTIEDGADCLDGSEIFVTIDVWSRAVGQVESKQIAGQVRALLHDATLSLEGGFADTEILHRDTRHLRDPDGLTAHAAITFRALVDRE